MRLDAIYKLNSELFKNTITKFVKRKKSLHLNIKSYIDICQKLLKQLKNT